MKKAIILALAFVMVIGVSAMATETRTVVMGNNNNIMLDDANIWLYPSRINNYPNLATGEFGDTGDEFYTFGINWKFGEEKPWVLGTYFSTLGAFEPVDYWGDELANFTGEPWYGYDEYVGKAAIWDPGLNGRSFDIVYGRQLGTMLFGFGLGYNHAGVKSERAGDESEESFTQYVFSLGLTEATGKWDVAGEIGIGSWTDKTMYFNGTDFEVREETKPDGFTDIFLRGRYFHKYNNTITLVPHASVGFGSRGVEFDPDIEDEGQWKQSRTAFELGVGMNYTPVTNVLAVLDFGFQYEKIKTEVDTNGTATVTSQEFNETTTNLPYWRIGLEGEVFNWMDVRLGATSNWESYKVEDLYKQGFINNETYLGVGLNFNRLHIDTYTDPEILLDGFNFISGSSDADDLNFRVTVLYEMF